MKNLSKLLFAASLSLFLPVGSCLADGSSIDKVYLPYVQPLEKELEYRAIQEHYDPADITVSTQKLGIGMAIGQQWFTELYLIGQETDTTGFDVDAWELEARWQMTEQGEYSFDWGSLFEFERNNELEIYEVKAGLLAVKDWQKISATANLFLIREWGEEIASENEASASLQLRYRLGPAFEPGIEYFSSEETRAIGPVIMGELTPGAQQKLFWHLGYIVGLDDDTADRTIKLQLEYEFL